jgi:hypothetical protein
MPEEYYYDSVDEAMRVWPVSLWVANGKPRVWVKVFEQGQDIIVWRDYGYGMLKLQTSFGVSEGHEDATVGPITAIQEKGSVRVYRSGKLLGPLPETDGTP